MLVQSHRFFESLIERLRADLRGSLRSLWRDRGTTLIAFAVLTLALASGTVAFSVVDAVTLRPLPYGDPDRLVGLTAPSPRPGRFFPAAPQDYFAWLDGSRTFEGLAASVAGPPLALRVGGTIEQFRTTRVTVNLFDVLRVQPAAGQFFGAAHEQRGGPAAVILSHDTWVRRFGSDPGLIGRYLTFEDHPREVLGVLPRNVSFPITTAPEPELYVPYVPTPLDRSLGVRRGFMTIVGRLREGTTVEQASADANRIASGIVMPLRTQIVGPSERWLLLVLVGVGILLLVTCANVANLFLARAVSRAREFATRAALGASTARLAGTLLLEGLILVFSAVAAALVLSVWGTDVAKAHLPSGLTRVSSITVDLRVAFVMCGLAFACGVGFTGASAWFGSRSDLMSLMKGGGAVVGGDRIHRTIGALLVANVSFVCILLVATTLVVSTFIIVMTADLGYDRSNVMLVSYQRSLKEVPPATRAAAAAAIRAQVLERAGSVRGVTAAAISQNAAAPLSGGSVRYSLTIPGRGELRGEDALETNMVTPGYFETMRMQLIRGRLFDASDGPGAAPVMLINAAAAAQYFPGRDPVGEIVTFREPTRVIGVLRAIHFDGPENEVRPAMYTPIDQEPVPFDFTSGTLIVRTATDPRRLAPEVLEAIRSAVGGEPAQPEFLDEYFRRSTAGRRFNAWVMGVFGLISVAIGAVGIYGTIAFFVARQVRPIGIRMALGGSPAGIVRSVLGDALQRVAAGIVIGLGGAWIASSALQSVVFGVAPTDIRVYLAVAAFLGLVGLAAAYVPARRAARVDPLVALREP